LQQPAWSPDGTKLAYVSFPGIWVVNADGTGKVQLTDHPRDEMPDWSPDGSKIAFTTDDSDIWVGTLFEFPFPVGDILLAGPITGEVVHDTNLDWQPVCAGN
jgi:Tol biopolymer transport system component